jgi:hypothetical protein
MTDCAKRNAGLVSRHGQQLAAGVESRPGWTITGEDAATYPSGGKWVGALIRLITARPM